MSSKNKNKEDNSEDDTDLYESGRSSLYNSSKTVPEEDQNDDEQQPLLSKKKLPFPKSVFFIFLNEFCERYSFYGLEAILSLFLRNILRYSENASTVIYHLFVTLSYATPVVGSIFADSVLGKYRTTVYFSIIHSVGNILLAIGALTMLSIPAANAISIIALIITAVGIGGIKPSVAAFGGDQFKLPEQEAQLAVFFAIYYVSINLGATLSEFFTPVIRKDVHCFGEDTCYSLAFAVPAVLMIFSLIAFVLGKSMYKIKGVTESVMVNTIRCVAYAIGNRKVELDKKSVDNSEEDKNAHWLDKASDKYDQSFINDIKALGKIMLLFSPLALFWALWSQQGTTWTFQATRMNGYLTDSISIKPDQVQITNSVLILFLVPIFEIAVYPLLSKCHIIRKPLQRITLGCFLIALSFVAAGIIEIKLEKSYPIIPSDHETSYNFVNILPCQFNVTLEPVFTENFKPASDSSENIPSQSAVIDIYENHVFNKLVAVDYNVTITNAKSQEKCIVDGKEINFTSTEILPQPGRVQTLVLTYNSKNASGDIGISNTLETVTKSNEGDPLLRIFGVDIPYSRYVVRLKSQISSKEIDYGFSSADMETLTRVVDSGRYTATITYLDKIKNETEEIILSSNLTLSTGGSYLLVIFPELNVENHPLRMLTLVLTNPNDIHMLWLVPQYFILTIGEILVAVTGYQFAYEQAPYTMKSLIQSVWLLTNAGGNLIDVIVIGFDLFPNQVFMFFFFSGLMIIDTILFAYLAYRYIPMTPEEDTVSLEKEIEKKPPRVGRTSRRQSVAETIATNIK